MSIFCVRSLAGELHRTLSLEKPVVLSISCQQPAVCYIKNRANHGPAPHHQAACPCKAGSYDWGEFTAQQVGPWKEH